MKANLTKGEKKMNTYSLSNLSQKEYNELLTKWRKRRNIYWLLSLLVIPAPLTVSFALFCNNNIAFLTSGGRHTSSGFTVLVHVVLGMFFPIIIVPILRFIPVFGHLVLGARIVE